MAKYVGATRSAVIRQAAGKDEGHKGRKGVLKSISKKFKSPAQAI